MFTALKVWKKKNTSLTVAQQHLKIEACWCVTHPPSHLTWGDDAGQALGLETDPAAAPVMEMGRIQSSLGKGNQSELLFNSNSCCCRCVLLWAGRCLWFSGRDVEVRSAAHF